MRLIMFGTGPFAVPTFKALLNSEHEVLALVTRPIGDAGKRRKSAANPTRDAGVEAGTQIFDPSSINEVAEVARLKSMNADLFVVCDYGQILSRECLAASRLGGINLHGSLLPRYRGAAPINWAIYNGDTILGVTVIHMSAFLDAGPSLVKAQIEVGIDETAETVEPKLAQLGVEPILEAIKTLDQWDGSSTIGEKQNRKEATKAPRLKKSDGLIDWTRPATDIVNQIRAFQPWPGTFTNWLPAERKPVRLIVHKATAVEHEPICEAGLVVSVDKEQLLIQSSDGALSLEIVQPAGKKPMAIADFLRGQSPDIGDRFGA